MALRPVESNWYRNFMFNLKRTKTRFDEAITQSTSGKKLNSLSDNPSDMSYVLNLRSKISQIGQFDKNINTAEGFLAASESALNQVQNLMYSVVSIAEQGASDTIDQEARELLADRVDDIRDEMVNYANTEIMGKYIFAGSATDTEPFTRAPDDPLVTRTNSNTGITVVETGAVTYNGNGDEMDVQADFSITIASNRPGNEVFGVGNITSPAPAGAVDIFDELAELIFDLRTNDVQGDTTPPINPLDNGGIAGMISTMNEKINQLSEAIGTIGERRSHLGQVQGMLKSFKTTIQGKMSSLEDADMAEVISNLGREEVGLNATLQAGARINRVSLMNFLG